MKTIPDNKCGTVIIGLGNPILSDDGVGIHVARRLRPCFSEKDDVDVIECYAGGLRLMEAMAGYKHAIIIDAMRVGRFAPGEVVRFGPESLPQCRNLSCSHDASFTAAMEIGRAAEVPLPARIDIIGVEGCEFETFSETLSPPVEAAAQRVVNEVLRMTGRNRSANWKTEEQTLATCP